VDITIASFDPKKVNRYCLGSPDLIIVHKAWGGYPFPVSCACVTEYILTTINIRKLL